MHFNRIRLTGFKSFVEPSELIIEPGLTGVVGPNGCGKSNLLEAIRWVMGESSYKSMRASGMDDVIFAGTSARPARNLAEVSVSLDNSDRSAPPAFNDDDIVEISRRIEREAGSAYRINGRDARARDVQLLFADASTGARSPALVRQGQIGEIISAKPQSRRKILEEAAGITGLHTRRHEAELKLNAAETNMTRLDDVVAQLESQLAGLKRQARQAVRYKSLSADIRRLEATSLYMQWRQSRKAAEGLSGQLDATTRVLATHTAALSAKTRALDEAGAVLPKLRENETVRAAVLQRINLEREGLEREERQAAERRDELKARLHQAKQDLTREQDAMRDMSDVLARLAREEDTLQKSQAGEADGRAEAAKLLQASADVLARSQQASDDAGLALSELAARYDRLTGVVRDCEARLARSKSEIGSVTQKREALIAASGGRSEAERLATAVDAAVAAAKAAEALALTSEGQVSGARKAESEARSRSDEARRRFDSLATEVRTLSKLLKVADGDLWPPLIDALTVTPGYETALGAALGEDIEASSDEAAPVHWHGLDALADRASLPPGARALADFVKAPAALARRLSQTGVIDRAAGQAAQKLLEPGQRLVSLEGDLWRWDGFQAAAEAPTPAAKRLAERNRLGTLEDESRAAEKAASEARTVFEQCREATRAAIKLDQEHRQGWRAATAGVETARSALGHYERKMSDGLQQISALEEAGRRLAAGVTETTAALKTARGEIAGLAKREGLQEQLDRLRTKLASDRAAYSDARARHDGLEREAQMRASRLKAIAGERDQWQLREKRAGSQMEILEKRSTEITGQLAALSDLPGQFEERRNKLLSTGSQAENERKQAADELSAAENTERQAQQEVRQAQDALNETREAKARLDAKTEAARERLEETCQRVREALQCQPEDIPARLELDIEDLPDADQVDARLSKLRDQRERLGGVNLRAETEAEEVATQLDELVNERDDLVQAIGKLRSGIASLNKEGRQRLLEAFEQVNSYFGSLFTTLFGGGKAELQLVESDDPLEAGLELLAHPPGKRPQVLSLLSGGEQALTAMALIFAVFLTNPSPICVLDEVDAPLDDHNVERFCNLLDAMQEQTETRFMVITHHPLTMSRMNRLFGVTMMERGVSQLVSVDLETAENLREAG